MSNLLLPILSGIGDHLAMTPMIRNLSKEGHHLYVSAKYPELYIKNPHIHQLGNHDDVDFNEMCMSECDDGLFRTQSNGKMIKHLKYHTTKNWCDAYETTYDNSHIDYYMTDEEDKKGAAFIKQFSKPVLIFQPTSYYYNVPDGNQRWWNLKHSQAFIDKMEPYFDILRISNIDEPVLKTKYIMPTLTFREIISILKHSAVHVSIHSSIQHASAIFENKGVVLFGFNTPEVWGYSHNTNLTFNSKCTLQPCHRPDVIIRDYWTCPNPICMNHPVENVVKEVRNLIPF